VVCESKCDDAIESIFASLVHARIVFLEFLLLFKLFTAASQSEYTVKEMSKWDKMASDTRSPKSSIVNAEIASSPSPLTIWRVLTGLSLQFSKLLKK